MKHKHKFLTHFICSRRKRRQQKALKILAKRLFLISNIPRYNFEIKEWIDEDVIFYLIIVYYLYLLVIILLYTLYTILLAFMYLVKIRYIFICCFCVTNIIILYFILYFISIYSVFQCFQTRMKEHASSFVMLLAIIFQFIITVLVYLMLFIFSFLIHQSY